MIRDVDFDQIIGQDNIVECLRIAIDAASERDEQMGHILFRGPSGCGKTSLAFAACKYINPGYAQVLNGGSVSSPKQLTPYIMKIKEGDVLFIDEIHRLSIAAEEFLYTVMEDFYANVGSDKHVIRIDVPRFTLIGATTNGGMLSEPLSNRFKHNFALKEYTNEVMATIINDYAEKIELQIDEDVAKLIAVTSRLVPRQARNQLEWCRDYLTNNGDYKLNKEITVQALAKLEIDERGFTANDRKYLDYLRDNYPCAVGLQTISKTIGIDVPTIENVIEPFLLKQRLIQKGSSGRVATSESLNVRSSSKRSGNIQKLKEEFFQHTF